MLSRVRFDFPVGTVSTELIKILISVCAFSTAILAVGCSTLAIPALDPSGNRIFAPRPTQLTLPQLHGPNGSNILPNASFPQPLEPANCLQGPSLPQATTPAVRVPSSNSDRGRCGQIMLTPTRIVAPVGGEVVLVAGICGEDGFFVSGEPIEWMLAPNTVGEIIEVGDDMKGRRKSFFASRNENRVEKLDVDFARGRTSSNPGVITRGSFRQTDDLPLKKGQTWVSLTSPTEGLSRVTVLAPDAEVWDKRRQTATIYWVDAEWEFPAPQALKVGEVATIATHVKKAEGFAPAEGWIVKYRLMNPEVAQIIGSDPQYEGRKDVRVDEDGKATILVRNITDRPATAVFEIEVARPAQAEEKMPELPLGRGRTVISWSAPVLKIDVSHNETTAVGTPAEFRVRVSNSGNLPAENVQALVDVKSAALRITSINPSPAVSTDTSARWDIGILPAGQVFEAVVNITPTVESDSRIEFSLAASPNIRDVAITRLFASNPTVELRFAPAAGMESVEVGQATLFEVLAKNVGKQTINNLVLTVDADPGLQSVDRGPDSGNNRIARNVNYLPPGQTQSLGYRFVARRAGELQAKLVASVNGQVIGERTAFVRAAEPTPKVPALGVEIVPVNGRTIDVGQSSKIIAYIQNTGQTRFTNLQTLIEYDSSLVITAQTQGLNALPAARQLVLDVPSLEPNKQISIEFVVQAINAVPRSTINIRTRTAEGITGEQSLVLQNVNAPPPGSTNGDQVFPSNAANPNQGSNGNGQSNRWSLEILPIESNVTTGEAAKYAITFRNNTSTQDEQVELNVAIPQGTRLIDATTNEGIFLQPTFSEDGRIVQLETLRYLRPNEAIRRIITLRHDLPGRNQVLEAMIRSAADPQGVRQQSTIHVQGR